MVAEPWDLCRCTWVLLCSETWLPESQQSWAGNGQSVRYIDSIPSCEAAVVSEGAAQRGGVAGRSKGQRKREADVSVGSVNAGLLAEGRGRHLGGVGSDPSSSCLGLLHLDGDMAERLLDGVGAALRQRKQPTVG